MSSARLTYREALVTGASRGIGRGLALELARRGARVHVCARGRGALNETVAEIEAAGGRAEAHTLDVSVTGATVELIRALDRRVGGLDLIVANAGVGIVDRGAPSYAWEAIGDACHTNFCGAAATLTAALPELVARGRGHLVGVSSLASFGALPGAAAYSAPKAGLSMLLECLRMDTLGTGVHVTAVHLGFVRTAMTARSEHPMPQLVDVATVARLLADRLPLAPATLDYPQPLALATRVAAHLPRGLRDFLATRQPWSR